MALNGKQKHYIRVGSAVEAKYGRDSAYAIAAALHDHVEDGIVEDAEIENYIRTSCPKASKRAVRKAAEAIRLLTRNKNMTYREYVKKLCVNKIARTVKMYDLEDNLKRQDSPPPGDLAKRYAWAVEYITNYNNRWRFPFFMLSIIVGNCIVVAVAAYYIYKWLS